MSSRIPVLLVVGLLCGPMTASATYIVDTGTPVSREIWSISVGQYFAGEFSLGGRYEISGVEGWFSSYSSVDGSVTVSLHADGGNIPGAVLFSQAVAVPASADLAWRGPTALAWDVGPGTYWVSFTPDANVIGYMPCCAPAPLGEYAQHSSGIWWDNGPNNYDYLDVGVRIAGSPVPEPRTLALLGLGLAGLGLSRRRKAN